MPTEAVLRKRSLLAHTIEKDQAPDNPRPIGQQMTREEAARRHRWDFLLTVAPVPVPGGTGFAIKAIATF